MANVRHILEIKGKEVWSVDPCDAIKDALLLMKERDIGALLVKEKDKVVGIFSERDYVRKVISADRITLESTVQAAMSHPVYYVSPSHTLDECMALMTAKHVRHLPVMENNQLVGMISIGDVVKHMISEKDITIRNLEEYIMGREFPL
jgi:CBS domain-containing protein